MKPSWPPRGESIVNEDYPPPPIQSAGPDPVKDAALTAYHQRREKRSAYARAYRAKNRERYLEQQARYRAKKRAERARWVCLLKHPMPLARVLPAVADYRPHNREQKKNLS